VSILYHKFISILLWPFNNNINNSQQDVVYILYIITYIYIYDIILSLTTNNNDSYKLINSNLPTNIKQVFTGTILATLKKITETI